jgi:2-methylcitrate dehydratase PrpD
MVVASKYAEYCSGLEYDDLPDDVVDREKLLLLDVLGNSIGAYSRLTFGETLLKGIRPLNQPKDGESVTVLATGEQLSSAHGAMVNASLAHGLNYDDLHLRAELHPSVSVVPAALAAAERADATGRELLTGIAAGYEVICRLGQALNPPNHADRGFHPTGTCGYFGATAAAGSVLGLTQEELETAFGLNGSQASGTHQYLENGAWNKRLHPGMAARSADLAIRLAREGFCGATNPIEGEDGFLRAYTDNPIPEAATDGLGSTFETREIAPHTYACCGFQHLPLDLLFDLVAEHELKHADVKSVTVRFPTRAVKVLGRPVERKANPRSYVDAQFSLPYGVALALTRGDANVDTFRDGVSDEYEPGFRRLLDATSLEVDEKADEAFPDSLPTTVVVETRNGRYTRQGEYRRGHPENPMSREDHLAKFEELTSQSLAASVRETIQDRVLDLHSWDVSDLLGPLREAMTTTSS